MIQKKQRNTRIIIHKLAKRLDLIDRRESSALMSCLKKYKICNRL